MTTVQQATYSYDPSGQRVKVVSGGVTTVYPTSYYNTDGTTSQKHIMAGGVVATVSGTGAGAVVYTVSTDHLTGSNVVTTSTGTQEELMDYFPFGSIRLDEKAGTFSEQRKFTGQEYDDAIGLTYMNARYYDGIVGRFISQDPLAIEALQTSDPNSFIKIISNPQYWNTYSYALNNPLVASDPSGLLTIVIAGTWHDSSWQNSSEGKQYLARVSDTFHETAAVFNWSGDDNRLARIGAGFDLARIVNGHDFKAGEQLNIVAHSHGGTVAILGAPLFDRAVDNLVTFGTPSRNDNQTDGLVNVLNHVQIYDSNDQVQQAAGNATSLSEKFGGMFFGERGARIGRALGWGEYGSALREFSGARNIDVSKLQDYKNDGGITNHGNLWSKVDGLNAARSYLRILK